METETIHKLLDKQLSDFVTVGGPLKREELLQLHEAGFEVLSDITSLTFKEFREKVKSNVYLQYFVEKVLEKAKLSFKTNETTGIQQ